MVGVRTEYDRIVRLRRDAESRRMPIILTGALVVLLLTFLHFNTKSEPLKTAADMRFSCLVTLDTNSAFSL